MKLSPLFKKGYNLGKVLSERKQGLQFLVFNLTGNGLTLLMNFVLPLFLTAAGYGSFALLYALYNLFTAVFTFGLDSSILKFSLDKQEQSNIVVRSFLVWILLSSMTLILLTPIVWYCSKYGILKASFSAALTTILAAFIVSFQRIILFYYIAKSEIKKYGLLFVFNKIAQTIVFVLPAIFLTEERSLHYFPILFLLQSILTFLLIVYLERTLIVTRVSGPFGLKKLIRFSLPLSLETFGNIGYSYGFNLLISPFLTLGQLGTLNIYTQLGNIISMTSGAFNNGYLPRFFQNIEIDFKKTVRSYFSYILMNATLFTLGVMVLGTGYFLFIAKATEGSAILMMLVYLIGILFYSFKSIGSSYLIIRSKTMAIALITIVTSLINIGIGMLTTYFFGFVGCIISLSLGYFLQMFLFNFEVIKKYLTVTKAIE